MWSTIKDIFFIFFSFFKKSEPQSSSSLSSSSSSSNSSAFKPIKISLSPGHGGEDSGAVGQAGTHEADRARVVSKILMDLFATNTLFDVQVVGYAETKKNYTQRVKSSDARGDNYYVPIHFNASENRNANGWLIFVDGNDVAKHPELKNLCINIIGELNKVAPIGFADFDSNKDGYQIGDGKTIYEETTPKADTVYLELGFISNPVWEQKILNPDFCNQLATAIYTGFVKFVKA